MIDLRVRSKVADKAVRELAGKVLGPRDYDVLLTGPARVRMPDNRPLCVYLPGVLAEVMTEQRYEILHELRSQRTQNRGMASGTRRMYRGVGDDRSKRSETVPIASTVVGAFDAVRPWGYCRLTAWTGRNVPKWQELHPLLQEVARHLAEQVPDRYAAQAAYAAASEPAWVVPGTPFTTITVNNCVDAETECLTRRAGWTRYSDIRRDDIVLAYDPATHTTRWEPLLDLFINEHYRGEMIEFSARGFSALTTPDHRWPLFPPTFTRQEHAGNGVKVKLTRELPAGYWSIGRGAPHEASTDPTYSDEFVRLVAWYITEGSLLPAGTSVSIVQSDVHNPVNVDSIRRDLKALGAITLNEWRNRPCIADDCTDRAVSYDRCNRHACQYRYRQRKLHGPAYPGMRGERHGKSRRHGLVVNEYRRHEDNLIVWVLTGDRVGQLLEAAPGKAKVPTMQFLSALTAEQARMFVDTCIAGDGSPEWRRFYQHHAGRMDAFVTAAVLAGLSPTIAANGAHCFIRNSRSTHDGARIYAGSIKRRTVEYTGTVWCPHVPSGHWVARRRGTVYLTGNSYATGVHTDKGDLDAGFSTIAVLRRGEYAGGQLIFPQYRVAVDMHHGDLILMDAHQWHGNVPLTCTCGTRLNGPCKTCGAERISLVSYMRTNIVRCGSAEEEAAKADTAVSATKGPSS